jgi:hypothetical protein
MHRKRSRWGRAARLVRCTVLAAGLGSLGLAGLAFLGVAPAGSSGPVLALHPNNLASHTNNLASHTSGSSPTPVGWESLNWSGYATTGSGYTAVTGHWTVPAVSAFPGATYSAAWAGIDGFNNNSLIQTGTEQDFYSGAAHYAAWWTTSSQNFVEQTISEPVSAGDPMSATISETSPATSSWTIALTDTSVSHGWSFTKTVTYRGPGTSAEWIMEAPTVGGRIASLAHYQSPLTFDPGSVNGASPGLVAGDGGALIVQRGWRYSAGSVESIPSAPDSDRDGFNISYGSFAPSAPAT